MINKNKNTKAMLLATALSAVLSQGCVSNIAQEAVIAVTSDTIADGIRTNFSEADFGSIDNSLKGKKSIYVGAKVEHKNPSFASSFGEMRSAQICESFRENTKNLKTQYECYIVASSNSDKKLKKGKYATPREDGVYLRVGLPNYQGVLSGSTYPLTYKDMATSKTHEFNSPNLYKQSQSIVYAAEFLSRLAKKADE